MPEITEKTLRNMDRMSANPHAALDAAIAEIRRQREEISAKDGQIEALVDVVKRYHEALPSPESTTILANLPAAAQARDKRLRAEAAVEALRPIPCSCRTVGTTSEDAAVITCLRCRAWSYYKAEAARLREEAGR